jgi:hypothetical protein
MEKYGWLIFANVTLFIGKPDFRQHSQVLTFERVDFPACGQARPPVSRPKRTHAQTSQYQFYAIAFANRPCTVACTLLLKKGVHPKIIPFMPNAIRAHR